jgi:hypothetical protein
MYFFQFSFLIFKAICSQTPSDFRLPMRRKINFHAHVKQKEKFYFLIFYFSESRNMKVILKGVETRRKQ